MKYKSALMTQGSGSLRGITASHNRGGQYFRGRVIPTNPSTVKQGIIRGGLRTLVNRWTSTLSAVQRAGWKTYADNTPKTDALGDAIILTGQQMYIRGNTSRLQASLPLTDAAPGIYDFGSFTPPTLTLGAASATGTLTLLGTDDWFSSDTANNMLVYTSPPQNPSKNFYKGPFQFAAKIPSIPANATTVTFTLPVAAGATGTRTFFRVTVSRRDGRLSSDFLGFGVP